jgi:hypothetical protein
MKTIHFVIDFLAALAPAFFILILPLYLATILLSPPFDAIAALVILAIGGVIIHFRDQIEARRAAWRARRGSHRIPSHGVSG